MLLGEFAQAEIPESGTGEGAVPACLLLPITAYSAESLKGNARRWMEYLEGDWSRGDLAEVCYLAGARRTPLGHRFAAVGRDAAELRGQLAAFLNGEASASPEAGVAMRCREGEGGLCFAGTGLAVGRDGAGVVSRACGVSGSV